MEAQCRAGVGQIRWQVIWFMDRRIGRGRVSRAAFVRIGTTSLPELEPRHDIASIIGYDECLSLSLGSAACTSTVYYVVKLARIV